LDTSKISKLRECGDFGRLLQPMYAEARRNEWILAAILAPAIEREREFRSEPQKIWARTGFNYGFNGEA
jgi:hypothetical protein